MSIVLGVTMIVGCSAPHRDQPTSNDGINTLALRLQTDQRDSVVWEPMVIQDSHGTLFAAAYNPWIAHPSLRKSDDGGRTWRRVEVGDIAQGAIGNSDVDLAVAPDGTLYFIAMTYSSSRAQLTTRDGKPPEGQRIAVGVSKDAGASWSWKTLSERRHDDRPWVAVAPNGVAHAIWNDGSGVYHAISRDRGDTWTQGVRIHDRGGSSHLAVGPRGEVAVRITPVSANGDNLDPGVELIAVSSDEGTSWTKYRAPGERDWAKDICDADLICNVGPGAVTQRWVEPITWDEKGRLYYLWTDSTGVWLARSSDRSATWSQWRVVASGGRCHFPYLVARRDGELAATWFCGIGNELRAHAARLVMSTGDGPPRVAQSEPFALDMWYRHAAHPDSALRQTGGEYLAITFLRDGGFGVVSPIWNENAHHRGFTWRVFQDK
jgi:hypothetical protein